MPELIKYPDAYHSGIIPDSSFFNTIIINWETIFSELI